jgi:hypothetical protein
MERFFYVIFNIFLLYFINKVIFMLIMTNKIQYPRFIMNPAEYLLGFMSLLFLYDMV